MIVPAKKSVLALGIIVALFAISWAVGHCSRWRAEQGEPPKPPPPIAGGLDVGEVTPPVAVPGATTTPAPTVQTKIIVRYQELTREQLVAEAAKFGLTIAPPAPPDDSTMTTQPVGAEEVDRLPVYPLRLAGETFCMKRTDGRCPVGETTETPTVDVAAWQLEPGGAIDLRSVWRTYQPPAPPKPKQGWLGNEGRFEKELGVGYVGGCAKDTKGEMVCDAAPGIFGGLALRGWRTGKATWNLRAFAGASTEGGAGMGGLSVSW